MNDYFTYVCMHVHINIFICIYVSIYIYVCVIVYMYIDFFYLQHAPLHLVTLHA